MKFFHRSHVPQVQSHRGLAGSILQAFKDRPPGTAATIQPIARHFKVPATNVRVDMRNLYSEGLFYKDGRLCRPWAAEMRATASALAEGAGRKVFEVLGDLDFETNAACRRAAQLLSIAGEWPHEPMPMRDLKLMLQTVDFPAERFDRIEAQLEQSLNHPAPSLPHTAPL